MNATKKSATKSTRPRQRPRATKPIPLQVRTVALSEKALSSLDGLSHTLSDYTGRTVSGSAIVRALLSFASAQPYDWILQTLTPLVEAEQARGVLWGKKG
jgi:hypothetical protein